MRDNFIPLSQSEQRPYEPWSVYVFNLSVSIFRDILLIIFSLFFLIYMFLIIIDGKGEVREELGTFPRTLFLMHQWFTSSSQFAFLLTSTWEAAGVVAPCSDPTCPHFVLSPTTSSESSSSNSSSLSSSTHPPCRTQRFKAQVIFALR
jgi:hypothetical protein